MRRAGSLALIGAVLVPLGCEQPPPVAAVVFVTLDTTRADYIGAYRARGVTGSHDVGDDVATPAIDAFATDASVFTNAATPVPITAPAHASLLTGLYPGGHGVFANGTTPLVASVRTLGEDLTAEGFETAAFVSAFVLNRQSGLDRGFSRYADDVVTERTATATTDLAIDWLNGRDRSRAPFLWVHYFDPHRPYEPPDSTASNPYAAEITYMDGEIGRLLDALRAEGLYDEALIVVAADHGEGLGDHGEEEHGVFLYDEVVRVPLLVKLPARLSTSNPVRETIDASVSLVDVVPTVHDVIGFAAGRELHGYSLRPLIHGSGERGEGSGDGTDPRAVLLETRYPERSLGWSRLEGLRTREWKYVRAPRPELYSLTKDPRELVNLAGDEPATLQRLAGTERRLYRGMDLGTEPGQADPLASEDAARLRSLGYLSPSPTPEGREDLPDPKDMMELYEYFERGKTAMEEERWEDADASFATILAEAPDNFVALFYAAIAATELGRNEEAEALYRTILERDPGNAQASYSLGQLLLERGENDEAEALLMTATHDEVYAPRANVLIAESMLARGDAASAHRLAARERGAPGEVGDRAVRVMALASARTGQLERALPELRDAVSRNPGDAALHAALGATLMQAGDGEDPEPHLRRAVAIDEENPYHRYNLACLLATKGRVTEAMNALTRAVELGYGNAEALLTDPDLAAVRELPGFEALVDRVSATRSDR